MKLSKEDFRGTGKVFHFTLEQMVKGKSNIISFIILFVMALLSGPVISLMSGDSLNGAAGQENQGKEGGRLTGIYYVNSTDYAIAFDELAAQNGLFAGIPVTEAGFSPSQWKENLDSKEALVEVFPEEGAVRVKVLCQEEKEVEADVNALAQAAAELTETARLKALGADAGQMEILLAPFRVEADTLSSYLDEEEVDFGTSFAVQYVYSILVLILGTMSAAYIIRAIIEEKSSKLVELLMISIRPLAMLLGKILAVMTYIFGTLALIFGGAAVSVVLTGAVAGGPSMGDVMAAAGMSSDMLNIGPMTIVIIILFLFSGYCTVGILSGIAGASCSTTEDMEAANMNVVLLVMAGYIAATITGSSGSAAVGIVTSFLPIVSVFCAPVQYVLGNISLVLLLAAWVVQMAVAVLLAVFCARVYSGLIFHKGNKLGLKELMQVKGGE